MATRMAAELTQMDQRNAVLEACADSSKITGHDGTGERSLGKPVLDMEIYMSTLTGNTAIQKHNVLEITDEQMKGNVAELIDSKLKTGLKMSRDSRGEEGV